MDRVCIYYQSPHLFPESLGSHAVRPGHPSTVSSSLPVEMTVLSKKLEGRTSPGSPVVKTPCFHYRGAQVQSLVRELTSHMPQGMAPKKKKRTKNKLEGKLQTHPPVLDSSLGWLVETVTAHFFQLWLKLVESIALGSPRRASIHPVSWKCLELPVTFLSFLTMRSTLWSLGLLFCFSLSEVLTSRDFLKACKQNPGTKEGKAAWIKVRKICCVI